jgi:hypothetical protein
MPQNFTFNAVPSWYWQASAAWDVYKDGGYKTGDLVHLGGFEYDRYICLKAHEPSYNNMPGQAVGGEAFWRIDQEERVPLNAKFADYGVYLAARDNATGEVVDLSTRVRRHGLVNTAKAGHYVLKYYCSYMGEDWELKRKIVVYEPDWMQNIVPQMCLLYPMFTQTLQNYTDTFWELNYLADNVRLGLGVSPVTCEKFTKCWTMPSGKVICYKGGYWLVTGYTFRDGDKVTLSDFREEYAEYTANLPAAYYVQSVRAEQDWSVGGTGTKTLSGIQVGAYKTGDWVRFLDKTYVCVEDHTVIDPKDVKKLKPKTIYPLSKETGKTGETVTVQSKYWEVGCRVVLVTYKLKDFKRSIVWDIDGLPTAALIGATIRRFRPMVDSQGYIFEYEYAPAAGEAENIVIREVGGDWAEILGGGWDTEADPETVILEDGDRDETYVEKRRRE